MAVDCAGDDAVGQRFCLSLKEKIRAAQGFELIDSQRPLTFAVHVVSVDEATDDADKGLSSSIAVAFTVERADGSAESFIDVLVVSLGRERVHSAAEQILATLDNDTESYRPYLK